VGREAWSVFHACEWIGGSGRLGIQKRRARQQARCGILMDKDGMGSGRLGILWERHSNQLRNVARE